MGRVLVLKQVGSLRSPKTSTRPLNYYNQLNTKFRVPTGGAFALNRLRIAPADTVAHNQNFTRIDISYPSVTFRELTYRFLAHRADLNTLVPTLEIIEQ